MPVSHASKTVTWENHENAGRALGVETDRSRLDRVLTTVYDRKSRATIATLSQKPSAVVKVHFLMAKGGFFAIVTAGPLVYLALPGSQLQLPDTMLNMPGEPIQGRDVPARLEEPETQPQQVTDQAMILGAGLASRFVPISGDLTGYAKPSVPLVGEDSVIVTLARHLQAHGIRRILVNTFYMPDILKEQLRRVEGIEFVFIDEDQPSGTAGGLLKAFDTGLVERDKPILIMQGDAVTDADLSTLLETHQLNAPLATIGVKHVSDAEVSSMAIVVTDRSGPDGESGYVQSFKEKPTLEEAGDNRLASIGFYVLDPRVFDAFQRLGQEKWTQGQEFDYAYHFFPALLELEDKAIYARMIPQPFYWSDIGRPDQYLATVRDIHEGKLKISLPETATGNFQEGVFYWEDAREKAVQQGAQLKGNMIVFNRRS